jgi:hypothetical protein
LQTTPKSAKIRLVPRSFLAVVVVAVTPLVVLNLAAGHAVAGVASTLVGLLVVTLLVALVRDRRHNAVRGDRGSTV